MIYTILLFKSALSPPVGWWLCLLFLLEKVPRGQVANIEDRTEALRSTERWGPKLPAKCKPRVNGAAAPQLWLIVAAKGASLGEPESDFFSREFENSDLDVNFPDFKYPVKKKFQQSGM